MNVRKHISTILIVITAFSSISIPDHIYAGSKEYPKLNIPNAISKRYGDSDFYILKKKTSKYDYKFNSSNRSIVTINKNTGYCVLKGPGACVITVRVKDDEKAHPLKCRINLTVTPGIVKKVSAIKKKGQILNMNWKQEKKNSGYEIEISNNKTFLTILTSKKVRTGQAHSANFKLKTKLFNNYVRIRGYKIANGKKIYGPYSIVRIK